MESGLAAKALDNAGSATLSRWAWEYYTRETSRVHDESAAGSDLDDDEAMRIATEEVSRARRRP